MQNKIVENRAENFIYPSRYLLILGEIFFFFKQLKIIKIINTVKSSKWFISFFISTIFVGFFLLFFWPNSDVGTQSIELRSETLNKCPDISALAKRASNPEVAADSIDLHEKIIVNVDQLKWDCNPTILLRDLFNKLTEKAHSDLQRGMIWVSYVQRTNSHTCYPPHDSEGWALYHPIALLENRLLHCSQVARLIVDGFVAAGIPARVLQMRGHQSAEFYANGRWIFAEGDILSGGQFLLNSDKEPVGIDEVKKDPSILDSVLPYNEIFPNCQGDFSKEWNPEIETAWYSLYKNKNKFAAADFISLWKSVFDPIVYSQWSLLETPYVIKKTATPDQLKHQTFGWNHWVYCSRSDSTCTN